MAAGAPLTELILTASSLAEDLGFVALGDLAAILGDRSRADVRLIGGQMVSLHAERWRLGPELYRETQDADLGVPLALAKHPGIVERLQEAGYRRMSGNRFVRPVEDLPVGVEQSEEVEVSGEYGAVIDILIPSYRSRSRDNVRVGDHLTTTEVPGLAYALNRPPVMVDLDLTRLNGARVSARVALPDETSMLVLRAHAWRTRGTDRDAVDLWRGLEIAAVAGVPAHELDTDSALGAGDIIRHAFSDAEGPAVGAAARARRLSPEGLVRFRTRIRALIRTVVVS